jgi:hypothetical protein
MIGMVTNLVDAARVVNKTAAHIAMHFENNWLERYPRPLTVIRDQGGEFIWYEFDYRLRVLNIRESRDYGKEPASQFGL